MPAQPQHWQLGEEGSVPASPSRVEWCGSDAQLIGEVHCYEIIAAGVLAGPIKLVEKR